MISPNLIVLSIEEMVTVSWYHGRRNRCPWGIGTANMWPSGWSANGSDTDLIVIFVFIFRIQIQIGYYINTYGYGSNIIYP